MSDLPTGAQRLLNDNIDSFFARFQKSHGTAMACREGCSRCCHATLTIFLSEALVIREWFLSLELSQRIALAAKWSSGHLPSGPDASGVQQAPCTFLDASGRCSIYPARPVVCRSQGLPLLIVSPSSTDAKKEVTVSHCPLNFSEPNSLPPMAEWLDLARLNTLQSLATQAAKSKGSHLPFGLATDKDGRVSLRDLRQNLISAATQLDA